MRPGLSPQQVVEHFHLQFCRLFMAGPDRVAFAIKGGCNLRFFFDSIRYSEDIDLDVTGRVATHALKERVSKTLRFASAHVGTTKPRHHDRTGQHAEADGDDPALEVDALHG